MPSAITSIERAWAILTIAVVIARERLLLPSASHEGAVDLQAVDRQPVRYASEE